MAPIQMKSHIPWPRKEDETYPGIKMSITASTLLQARPITTNFSPACLHVQQSFTRIYQKPLPVGMWILSIIGHLSPAISRHRRSSARDIIPGDLDASINRRSKLVESILIDVDVVVLAGVGVGAQVHDLLSLANWPEGKVGSQGLVQKNK